MLVGVYLAGQRARVGKCGGAGRGADHPPPDHHNEEDTAPHPVLETLEQARAACERSYLVHVLTATRGSVARAARLAGVHCRPLYKLLQKYTLDPEASR